MLYDAFICHASEDKEEFVRPLANALRDHHLEIWFDEFSLSVGDSLRRSIDKGLSKSRFGIVVLSHSFFRKGWAQRELDGLVARQTSGNNNIILPIWHGVSLEDILDYSPPLADTLAIQSANGFENVLEALLNRLRPDESPLISARDELFKRGITPPVISDEWWLDIVEASNRINNGGAYIPPETVWGRWTFPLPHQYENGALRGKHLAWTALQIQWSEHAEKNKICQISPPNLIHEFLDQYAGLKELALQYPDSVACYAPQLTIPDFSGNFSESFDLRLKQSIESATKKANENSIYGTMLTIDNSAPRCDLDWALRHPEFGGFKAESVASFYTHGEMFSPYSSVYEDFDYYIWLLSDESLWLPVRYREFLTLGMGRAAISSAMSLSFSDENKFVDRLYRARSAETFKITKPILEGLYELVEHSLNKLELDGKPRQIVETFIESNAIEDYFSFQEANKARRV